MIRRLTGAGEDLKSSAGIDCRGREDRLEELARNSAGAREGREDAAWTEEFHRQQIYIFVAASGFLDERFRIGEFWWVEDNQIERTTSVAA